MPAISNQTPGVSVIIPTLNEEANIVKLIHRLRQMEGISEVIVCDGSSEDETARMAREAGAIVVIAPRNRGVQMNAGARAATGAILWFLHADAWPHPHSAMAMVRAVSHPRRRIIMGGNFRLRFAAAAPVARAFEAVARVQRRLGIYYGDSGIWVQSEVFHILGGFRAIPLFEDYDFARRLESYARRHGYRTMRCALPLTVSARRFKQHPWRTLALWTTLQILYSIGVAPERLAKLYHAQRVRRNE